MFLACKMPWPSYWPCRATYDYEKKLYNDHLESLQVMEKNYITMARELEKLRAELTNTASLERRHGTLAYPYFTFVFLGLSYPSWISLNLPLILWWLHVGGPYGTTQNNEIEASGNSTGQNTYEDGYGVAQVCHIFHLMVFISWYFVFEFIVLSLSVCFLLLMQMEKHLLTGCEVFLLPMLYLGFSLHHDPRSPWCWVSIVE